MKRFFLAVLFVAFGVVGAQAQNYALTNRVFVQSPQALAMGDAGVAWASPQTVFFYNPAHLGQLDFSQGVRLRLLGARGSFSTDFFEKYDFYQDRIDPFIEQVRDIDDPFSAQSVVDTLDAITRDIRNLGEPSNFNIDAMLPSLMFRAGNVNVGLGLFAQSNSRLRISSFGGVANIEAVIKGDAIGVGTISGNLQTFDPTLPDLSIGLTTRVFQRTFTHRNAPLDQLVNEDQQAIVMVSGWGYGIDLGATYDTPFPGLTVGAAVFDVLNQTPTYEFLTGFGAGEVDENDPLVEATIREAELRTIDMMYRVGASYQLPTDIGPLRKTGVTLEYMGYDNPGIEQPVWSRLHMGAQASLLNILTVRGGLNQGYTTVGAGLSLGPLQLNYAYYGMEEGRQPGQLPRWNHTAQFSFVF